MPQGILGAHPDREIPASRPHRLARSRHGAWRWEWRTPKRSSFGKRIFAVFSDGELQEGSSWEGAMMAANLHLDNLLAFIDLNDIGGLEKMSESHTAFYPLREKFESFGWESAEVNGHDCAAIHRAVAARRGGRPLRAAVQDRQGRGVAFMEHVPIWHYRSPSKEEYAAAIRDLREVSA